MKTCKDIDQSLALLIKKDEGVKSTPLVLRSSKCMDFFKAVRYSTFIFMTWVLVAIGIILLAGLAVYFCTFCYFDSQTQLL